MQLLIHSQISRIVLLTSGMGNQFNHSFYRKYDYLSMVRLSKSMLVKWTTVNNSNSSENNVDIYAYAYNHVTG